MASWKIIGQRLRPDAASGLLNTSIFAKPAKRREACFWKRQLPKGADEVTPGMLWSRWDTFGLDGKGAWGKHEEIRLLADNSLVIAPPSTHVETGKPYRFLGLNSPDHIFYPEVIPQWILDMPRLQAPRFASDAPKAVYTPKQIDRTGTYYDREEVLRAIGRNKLAVAKEMGLVTKSDMPNPSGWVNCYVPGREDPRHSNPSGSFNFADGTFQDRKDLSACSFFDLLAMLQPGRSGTGERSATNSEIGSWVG